MRTRKEIEARLSRLRDSYCDLFGRGMDCDEQIISVKITELEWVLNDNYTKYDRL